MREEERLLEKSQKFLSDARSAFQQDMSLETVQNRLYYAMFLAARAALLNEGVETSTHSSVNRQVGKIFVKEKDILDPGTGSFYSRQQTLREQADYDPETSFEREEISESLEKAEEFVQKMNKVVETSEGRRDTG